MSADHVVSGNITKAQLRSGYEALTRIEKCILEKKFGNEFNHAMNDYYTRIPHFHGWVFV